MKKLVLETTAPFQTASPRELVNAELQSYAHRAAE
jgi:hypothetical protein